MPLPQIFSLSANLPDISSARQRFIASKAQGKSCFSANWSRTKSVCRQIGLERSLFSANWPRTKSVSRQIKTAMLYLTIKTV